ncbi:HEPN/Toprim-associated domain-containing protein [Rhizorhapis suberifaciens]|uniref:HEPN/Toprim N-terminal domain-containing protein n=1 Tax=Rhizorhapis suberifaciens TaxID=13656 RepID=A0A840HWZ7_9SPHN|nr:HEPN/Toprim-associated domain-containing protein [Rhizorhapis suberifaciens]MBB4642605.1 hypothetical protein [Rhizorhapis suberifaciens]
MGTEIELTVEGIALDWSKNMMGIDHGVLFQEGNRARRRAEEIDYYYFEQNQLDAAPYEAAFVRPLARVLPRLNLLGHGLDGARFAYEAAVQSAIELAEDVTSVELPTDFMSFDDFCAFCRRYPLSSLGDHVVASDAEGEAEVPPGRFAAHADEIRRIPKEIDPYPWLGGYDQSERRYFASVACILDAYSMLQVLGRDGANADAEVIWQYGPLVKNGWEDASSFVPGAPRHKRILVATEGTSDARIVRRALDVLRPDVTDFFRFIDVNESHPFWGTGSLVKFAEGLVRIDVQNQILFLLDNDAEGKDADRRLQNLGMPENMRAMVLPDQEAFRAFPARGPQGISSSDINGRAAAIECYLDLALPDYGPAQVLWSNYKKEVDAWQGALDFKESYAKHFFAQTDENLAGDGYDTSKLEAVLNSLIAEATILVSGRS